MHVAWVAATVGGLTQCFCCVQAAVGWDVAKANNVVLIGLHGRVKYKESYLVWILSLLRELKDLPVLSESPHPQCPSSEGLAHVQLCTT